MKRTPIEIHADGARLSRQLLQVLKRSELIEVHREDDDRVIAHALMMLCLSAFYSLGTPFHHMIRLMAVAWGVWSDEPFDPNAMYSAQLRNQTQATDDARKLLEEWEPPPGRKPA